MTKQSGLLRRKRALQKQLRRSSEQMIQGSLVKLRQRRCGKMNCHCRKTGDPGHGFFHYLSVPTPKKTEMHYLSKSLLPQIPKHLKAFKLCWEVAKMISQINLALLKQSASRRKSHVR